MSKDKVYKIITAVFMIVLGVLIAINGGGAAIDLYFGIVIMVAGVSVLVLDIINLANTKHLSLLLTGLSFALISVSAGLLSHWLSFAVIIGIAIFALIGFGGALIMHGVYLIVKRNIVYGIIEAVLGVLSVTFTILFLTVPEFQTAFWIILGITVIVYGVLYLLSVFIDFDKVK